MAVGSVEALPSGSFRAVVRAGVDPITHKRLKITETWPTEAEARSACERLSAQVEADTVPDRAATVEVLLRRWMGVADHELSTRETTEGYVRRTILPALGDMPLRKIQHRVDLLDRLYTHLRRCNELCDGRRPTDEHTCKPMSAGAIRRLHGILSAAFNYGISWGWMERNPAEHSHPPKLVDAV